MKIIWCTALLSLLLFTLAGTAQQKVPFRNNIPVAPTGLADRPLPRSPIEFDTAEGQRIRVVVVTKGLTYPWSLAFLPDGGILVAERTGKLRIVRNGVLDPQPIAGVPASRYAGKSGEPGAVHGLMDLALHPGFAENHLVYFTYTKPLEGERSTNALARGRWDGKALTEVRDIFVAQPGAGASRIAFGRDGTIFMTNGGNDPQDLKSHGGKLLRVRDDGSVPSDNPFVGREGVKPEIYSLGHRTSLGLAIHPVTGEVWENENGPNGRVRHSTRKPTASIFIRTRPPISPASFRQIRRRPISAMSPVRNPRRLRTCHPRPNAMATIARPSVQTGHAESSTNCPFENTVAGYLKRNSNMSPAVCRSVSAVSQCVME